MAGFGWIHTHDSVHLILYYDIGFNKEIWFQKNLENKKLNTIKTHHITKKHILYKDSPGNKHKKGKNKSIKTWCLRSSVYFVVCVWCSCFVFVFSFCILVSKLLVFLFAMLLCFSWFNPLLFKKKLLGSKQFFITKSIKTNSW